MPLKKRQNHLRLHESCWEIGGRSTNFKSLLAYELKTTIPYNDSTRVLLCHACGNHKCSNPKHLYWGTDKENIQDSKKHGTWSSIEEKMLKKYGKEKTREIHSKAGKLGGNTIKNKFVKINKEKILFFENEVLPNVDVTKFGWIQKVSNITNLSHTQIRRIMSDHLPNIKTFKRKS